MRSFESCVSSRCKFMRTVEPSRHDVDGHGDGAEGDEGQGHDNKVEAVPPVAPEGPAPAAPRMRPAKK